MMTLMHDATSTILVTVWDGTSTQRTTETVLETVTDTAPIVTVTVTIVS